jgi:riboflavin kinase/FMN adenylyltransferase
VSCPTKEHLTFPSLPEPSWRGCCVSIGNFDGVHLGHAALVEALHAMAVRMSVPGIVLTFHPHPAEVVGAAPPRRLLPIEDRARMLRALGADGVWVLPFDMTLAQATPAAFASDLLGGVLAARGVVIGPDFRFGAARAGDSSLLGRLGHSLGFEVAQVPPVMVDGDRVSSSRIRTLLASGQVETAARLLGRHYRVKGTVVEGRRVGTRIGFPTANIRLFDDVLIPAHGVYVVHLRVGPSPAGCRPWEGVASVGVRPTLGQGLALSVEAHAFGIEGPLYGEVVTLEFLARLRDEKRFDSMASLAAAIREDVEKAKAYFAVGPA